MSRWHNSTRIKIPPVNSMHELGIEIQKAFAKHTEVTLEVEFLKLEEEGTAFAISNPALIKKLSNNKSRIKSFRVLGDGTFRVMPICGDKNGQFVTFQVLYQKQVLEININFKI